MENTTNINDLPMEPEMSGEAPRDAPREFQREAPREPPREARQELKKVRFNLPEKNTLEKHKVLILASVFFLLFSDVKVKIYLMNILVVIFGDALRTSGGGSTKLGQLFYMTLFGMTLWVATILVDWSKAI